MLLDSGIQRKERTVRELEQAAGKKKIHAHSRELSSSQKVGRLQLFDITCRKKDESPITSEAGEIMVEYKAIASSDSFVNLEDIDNRIITEVLGPERYGRVRFQGSGVNPTQPNILDPARNNTCLWGVKLKLKFRG
ncbi:hypothetical protein GOBAR_AA02081 [Gossypium barbadense]|uniref:Uncharacterized protein n=1 Tax=Gossypium barbadense TaxID=3634 RepID=A0A2P5YSD6_GOSBA|nr:hypothetical protein GOBAR_AA02081 [Gossypium barbadense]